MVCNLSLDLYHSLLNNAGLWEFLWKCTLYENANQIFGIRGCVLSALNHLFLSAYFCSTCCAAIEGPIKLYCRFAVMLCVLKLFCVWSWYFSLQDNTLSSSVILIWQRLWSCIAGCSSWNWAWNWKLCCRTFPYRLKTREEHSLDLTFRVQQITGL